MAEAPSPKPSTRPRSNSCPITDLLNGFSRDQFGVYKIGLAHFKVGFDTGSQEHNALEAVAKRSFDFMVPTVYCHGVYGKFYHVVHSILPGKSLAEVWPTTKDDALRLKWMQQIAEAYLEMSKWRGDHICGVDSGNLKDHWPTLKSWHNPANTAPEALRENFVEMGLDCTTIVFSHNYLMPLSFMVDESQGLLGITMWSAAGFVPKDWVCNKTRSAGVMESIEVIRPTWSKSDLGDWHAKSVAALEQKGFPDLWERYAEWRSNTMHIRHDESGRLRFD